MVNATNLPTNIDSTYADRAGEPGDKIHQQHHDIIHAAVNALTQSGGSGVTSVNGQTGDVTLSAADVGAQPAGSYPTSTAVATIAQVTQAQYDALTTPDPATLYLVVG